MMVVGALNSFGSIKWKGQPPVQLATIGCLRVASAPAEPDTASNFSKVHNRGCIGTTRNDSWSRSEMSPPVEYEMNYYRSQEADVCRLPDYAA